jgi:hypothetical protein
MTPKKKSSAPRALKYRIEYVEGIGPEKDMSIQDKTRIRKFPSTKE